ncbi:MAG TPA: glycine cleavage system aminomethyltransferase GcvT [Thermoplasmata archaeon]|nr:glycine cleavage system aminomethyltransferase GcvT [Thermoplasmata archaeon]
MSDTLAMPPPPEPRELARTPLFDFHVAHGAHLVPFAGWEMPLYYESILAEHEAVRTSAGLFDVSHMGILTVVGRSAASLLSRRTTADVARLVPGQVRYTFLLDPDGRIVDDLLVTRVDAGGEEVPSFVVVPNAATTPKVFDLLRQHRRPDTTVARWNGRVAILAVQGPKALSILEDRFGWRLGALPSYHARLFGRSSGAGIAAEGRLGMTIPDDLEEGILASRTGYTGEPGAELFVRGDRARAIADELVAAGVRPAGLGARDTLRLEKGYLLSGQDFHLDRTPLEAGQSRFVELDHPFVGREVLAKQAAEGVAERLVGLVVDDPSAIPRHGTPVLSEGSVVATATSGGRSPTLKQGIALAYLPVRLATPGTELLVDVRGRQAKARVTKLPFLSNPKPPA